MPVYRPKELIEFLRTHGFRPLRHLSQNFLIDGNIVRKIADAAMIQPGDFVIEIGPGPGALTEELLLRQAKVIAIELDKGFALHLSRFAPLGDLTILEQDALTLDIPTLVTKAEGSPIKIVGNLPYHITTPLLAKFLPFHSQITSYTIMVQKEFARRMIAAAGSRDYSSFTIFLSLYATPHCFFDVKPGSFLPKPKVDSTVVHLISNPHILANPEKVTTLTRAAFNQRRKKLTTSLTQLFPKATIEHALQSLNLPLDIRPENISPPQWLQLSKILPPAALESASDGKEI